MLEEGVFLNASLRYDHRDVPFNSAELLRVFAAIQATDICWQDS